MNENKQLEPYQVHRQRAREEARERVKLGGEAGKIKFRHT